ncbi:MAG: hypothetical protein JO306_16300, partial [Gemmatimonadetes bacterium]|nr:hypothetical protein [Gemmatimonadota bacterium]
MDDARTAMTIRTTWSPRSERGMPMRILRLRFACVAMGILAPAALAAQVRRVGPMRVQAESGASVTVAFGVRNPGGSPASAGAAVPRGWPLV